MANKIFCSVEFCSHIYYAKGWCQMHYVRNIKHGSPLITHRIHDRHGMYGTAEYRSWYGMKSRCNNSNVPNYRDYGGRGIKVCERWNRSFVNFYEDMGTKPTPKHSIDRIDNDGDYESSNCRWATRVEQNNNQRMRRDNTSGYKGVSYDRGTRKWRASIQRNKDHTLIGCFDNIEDAVAAYSETASMYE